MKIIYIERTHEEMYIDPVARKAVAIRQDASGERGPQLTCGDMDDSWNAYEARERGAREIEVDREAFDSLRREAILNDPRGVERILALHFAPLLQ